MRHDGTFDPLLKAIAGAVLALAVAKVVWQWLSTTFWRWLSMDVWGWIAEHPWWSALIAAPLGLVPLLLVARLLAPRGYVRYTDDDSDDEAPAILTYGIHHLDAMEATEFERACAALLARDGFTLVQHSGRAGDLGADVIAWDHLGRKVVVQCKHYGKPVGSRDVQTFNGTARPEHHADVPVMIGLNGFTRDARDFAARHNLTLVNRQILRDWAQGTYLYDAIDDEADRAAA
ncbi:restriction endonuclease [Streptomyces viridifaciens]|nr:restriction endonuclease [Streptomyces viridifaciens]UKZ05357.1 restriction endonuclease [Streptomyces viridifaciens]